MKNNAGAANINLDSVGLFCVNAIPRNCLRGSLVVWAVHDGKVITWVSVLRTTLITSLTIRLNHAVGEVIRDGVVTCHCFKI
jgi:hypothetical protein